MTGSPAPAIGGAAVASQDPANAAIRIEGLSHYFLSGANSKDRQVVEALSDIDLAVAPQEFVALVGPSGCGKTTLLNILSGLEEQQSGQVSILGSSPAQARRDIAYMFARDALLPWRTTQRNVELSMEAAGVTRAERRERAKEMLVRVKLGDFTNAYPAQLSHGMRQRAALARTFSLRSDVLLMDEPFAALDAHLRITTGDLLLQLWEEDRRTVVFVTHDLHEALALADRVIVFQPRPGRIRTEILVPFERPRSVEDLQNDPEYHELYRHLWRQMSAIDSKEKD